jgi:hypothetical protein
MTNIFPELIIPNFICKFENYTQSFSQIQLLIYVFAIWGFLHLLYFIFSIIRIGRK